MMGTTFFLSDNTTLDSSALAEAITAVLIHEKNNEPVQAQEVLEQFDGICAELLIIVLTLVQWSVRGRPREADLNGAHCGSTNAYENFLIRIFTWICQTAHCAITSTLQQCGSKANARA